MELHSVHKTFHHSHLGEEKHQMLNLNRRLETYLSRVKLLEEENAQLAKEIQALRRSNHGATARRKGLEEELRQARLEVDSAWRDRIHMELEVNRLSEELQNLDQLRQREAQAKAKAKTKVEQSRRELEEEERAQMWLREKVNQLEHEMSHLIQTHEEDVAHLEATLTHSRVAAPPTVAQRGTHTSNLLQLGEQYSQRASRAWQEAAEAHQGQLARLEESLNQARSRLTQVGQEKSESQLKLRALEKEIASAQDVRMHLEKMVAQQGHEYSQEIQKLQEHTEGLEAEREELGQQIDRLVLENRGLQQTKMSLGLEVATYRALLDSESLRGDISLLNEPRHVSIADAVFSPQGIKKNYTAQLSDHKTTSFSSVRGVTRTGPTVITTTPAWSRKPVTLTETPRSYTKLGYEDRAKPAAQQTPYPKILQDGAENFRPQEVHEKVTYAEPLSPPNEQEVLVQTSEDKDVDENWSNVGAEPPSAESVVSHQVASALSTESPFNDEVIQRQFATANLTPYHVKMAEEPCGLSDEPDGDVPFEIPAKQEEMQEPCAPTDAWVEKEHTVPEAEHVQEDKGPEAEHVQEETDSETEAVLEPNFESRTSSPMSDYEPDESLFNKVTDFQRDGNILKEDQIDVTSEIRSAEKVVTTTEMDVEDKLYPDGEEMDTWDSVIEKKVDLKTYDGANNEEKQYNAEPEEDISAKEPDLEKSEIKNEFAANAKQEDNLAYPMMETQVDDEGQHADQEHAPSHDNEEDDEEEDSQNVSVSWRTEVESDSYAQDNTLADTRPLIRYKSDETDANTQLSHVDESESSEGEEEKKIGETGTSKRFGTMEDLCEEVEGEALDEEYDLGYTHAEDRGVEHDVTVSEHARLENEAASAHEMLREVSEGHLNEEIEELSKPLVPANLDYDEELEIDRLVEEELENLATDSYSTHFAQQQVHESQKTVHLQSQSAEDMMEQEGAGKAKMEDTSLCAEQPFETADFSDLSVVKPEKLLADEELQDKDQEGPEKREEKAGDEHNESMGTHVDTREDHSCLDDYISRPDTDQINKSEDVSEVKEVVPEDKDQEGPEKREEEDEHNESLLTHVDTREDHDSFDDYIIRPDTEEMNKSEDVAAVKEVEIEDKDQEGPEKREDEDEHNESMVTHVDITEDHYSFGDHISRPDIEEINKSENVVEVKEVVTEDKDQGGPEKREEEDGHNEFMVTHKDTTEDHYSFGDFISMPVMGEITNSEGVSIPTKVKEDVSVLTEKKELVPKEVCSVLQGHVIEDVADCQEFPDVPEESEWEVLKNPSEDSEIGHNEDNVPETAETYTHDDIDSDEGVVAHKEEPLDISPNSVPDENKIFVVKESTEVLNTNGKDSNLHDFFSSGIKSDFWLSSLETGATNQPDDPRNEAAEQTNQNLGFADNLVWGDLENPNVVNWNSRLDNDSSKALAAKKEQEHLEVKQALVRNVVEVELDHSEESEVEGESWSSGDETIYKI